VHRSKRHTEPVFTRDGRLDSYVEIERRLSHAEALGRLWVLARAKDPSLVGRLASERAPQDVDVLDLHHATFSEVFDWAGQPRRANIGPGGQVWVDWPMVRVELRNLTENIRARIKAEEGAAIAIGSVARLIADAHHRFQQVHPFEDTNGRTGRLLDHYYLWVTFGLRGATLTMSPFLEHFPTQDHEEEYYAGLREADGHEPERLHRYFEERVREALAAWQDAVNATRPR
jgi:fido (protein-threonine AMPylation protein)